MKIDGLPADLALSARPSARAVKTPFETMLKPVRWAKAAADREGEAGARPNRPQPMVKAPLPQPPKLAEPMAAPASEIVGPTTQTVAGEVFGFAELGVFGAYAASSASVQPVVTGHPQITVAPQGEALPPGPEAIEEHVVPAPAQPGRGRDASAAPSSADTPQQSAAAGFAATAAAASPDQPRPGRLRASSQALSSTEPAPSSDRAAASPPRPSRRQAPSVTLIDEEGEVQVVAIAPEVSGDMAPGLRRLAAQIAKRLGLTLAGLRLNGANAEDSPPMIGARNGPGPR